MRPESAADNAESWVRSWTASASERATAAQALSDQISTLAVSASDRQRTVTVTVNGSGTLVDLRLTEEAGRGSMDDLARTIMQTMRAAQGSLAGRVAEIAARTTGPDAETTRAIVAGFERRFPLHPDPAEEPAGLPERRPHGW